MRQISNYLAGKITHMHIERQGTSATSPLKGETKKVLKAISIAEQIADEIASDIIDGRLSVGERLGEESIAERFDVSRGPVRSALRILEKKGLAEFFPRRGAFVSRLTTNQLRDIIDLRFWLLVLASRSCARQITPEAQQAIQTAIDAVAGQVDDSETSSWEFSNNVSGIFRVMVQFSQNERLMEMVEQTAEYSAWHLIWKYQEIDFGTPERRKEVYLMLSEVTTAAIAGDVDGAERGARQYLDDSLTVSLAAWDKNMQNLNPASETS